MVRDFYVGIILTFAPHAVEKSQAGKAGGKKCLSRQEVFGALQRLPPSVLLCSLNIRRRRHRSDPRTLFVTLFVAWVQCDSSSSLVVFCVCAGLGRGIGCSPALLHIPQPLDMEVVSITLYVQSGINFGTNKPDFSLSSASY